MAVPFSLAGLFKLGGELNWLFCCSSFLMIPHYVSDLLCYQTKVLRLLLYQIETKLILGYNLAFCIRCAKHPPSSPRERVRAAARRR